MLSLENTSDSVLVQCVLPNVPFSTLTKLCSTNDRLTKLCREPELWRNKLAIDYPDVYSKLSPVIKQEIIPYELYLFLLNSNKVPVYYHGDRLGTAYLELSDTNPNVFYHDPDYQSIYRHLVREGIEQPFMNRIINKDLTKFLIKQMFPNGKYINYLISENRIRGDELVTKVLITDHYVDSHAYVNPFHEQR